MAVASGYVASAYVAGVLPMCWVCACIADTVVRRFRAQGRLGLDAGYRVTAAAASIPWLLLLSVGEGSLGLAAVYLMWLALWRRHAQEVPARQPGWMRLHAGAHGVVIACVLLSVKSGQEAFAAFTTGAVVGMLLLLAGVVARRGARATRRAA